MATKNTKLRAYSMIESRHNMPDDTWQQRSITIFAVSLKEAKQWWNNRTGGTDGYKFSADRLYPGPMVAGAVIRECWSKPEHFPL